MFSWETSYVISVIFLPSCGSQEHCCNNKFISTIHGADGVGVKLYNPTPQCTHTETQTPPETLQKPLSELRGRSKTAKVKTAGGCFGRKLYYVIILPGSFYLIVMKLLLYQGWWRVAEESLSCIPEFLWTACCLLVNYISANDDLRICIIFFLKLLTSSPSSSLLA